jgi:ribonuclease HI
MNNPNIPTAAQTNCKTSFIQAEQGVSVASGTENSAIPSGQINFEYPLEMPPLLLPPGDTELNLYADGSFRQELLIGAWAYRVPTFSLAMSKAEVGASVEWFELAGVVAGIEAISRVDRSARAIHVHSDSAFVGCLLRYLMAGQLLPARRSFERVGDLIRRLAGIVRPWEVRFSRCHGKNPIHRQCHNGAVLEVRERIRTDPVLVHGLALKRDEERFSKLSAEREGLHRRLEKVEDDLLFCEVRLNALRVTAPLRMGKAAGDGTLDPLSKPPSEAE